MSNPPPPSPLVSPDLRRQLQQRYEEAARLSATSPTDRQRIHELLAKCLRADPGNILYLDALLANLRRWQPKTSWWAKWAPRWKAPGAEPTARQPADAVAAVHGAQYPVLSTEYELLRTAPDLLVTRRDDPTLLRQLAAAAGACDFDEAELRYLAEAQRLAPSDPNAVRSLARAVTRQGRFEQAAAGWQNLLAVLPGDAEADKALADLDLAEMQRIEQIEQSLASRQARGGPLLSILGEREALQLARAEQRLTVALRRANGDPHPKAQSLVARLENEHHRLHIEILHLRCERLPGDWQMRVELARRLKAAGNYSGAIQRLDEALRLQPGNAETRIELGECWQHLRQFAKALDCYQAAIDVARDDNLSLSLYRAGVLAAAMGRIAEARGFLGRLLSAEGAYRDARERLDNLGGT